MNPYNACASCGCYVKLNHNACPFCGAMNRHRSEPAARRTARSSRAHWLAFGSTLAVAGCSGEVSEAVKHPMDAAASSEASNGGAPADAASSPASEASCCEDGRAESASIPDASREKIAAPASPNSPEGGLHCYPANISSGNDAGAFCDRASEWCYTNHGFETTGCVSFASTCPPGEVGDACAVFYWNAAACAPGDHRCACLSVTCNSGWCDDDHAGGITVSCGSCYGAPPPRLERLARAAPVA